jgi:hypothetical protein
VSVLVRDNKNDGVSRHKGEAVISKYRPSAKSSSALSNKEMMQGEKHSTLDKEGLRTGCTNGEGVGGPKVGVRSGRALGLIRRNLSLPYIK